MNTRDSEGPALHARWRVAARLGYLAVILLATLSELQPEPTTGAMLRERLQRSVSTDVSARDAIDAVRNLLLFAGWGLVWCMTARRQRPRSLLIATITGLLLSVSVEAAQLFSPVRRASILDVLTNTSGALLGGLTVLVLLRAMQHARGARSFVGVPMLVFALAYGSAAMLEMVLPGLRRDLLAGASGGPGARLQLALSSLDWQLPPLPLLVLQFLLMLPAGAFLLTALVEHGSSWTRALLLSAGAGLLVPLLLELARGATGQPVEPGMAATHASGLLCGVWMAGEWLPAAETRLRGRRGALVLTSAYAVVLLLWRWQPFRPRLQLDQIVAAFSAKRLIPLQALAERMDLFSASITAVGFLLHVPLGAVLAVWPVRSRGALKHVLPALYFVVLVEAGQILLVGRYFDVTDIIIGAAGVLAGWSLMRRAGFRPA